MTSLAQITEHFEISIYTLAFPAIAFLCWRLMSGTISMNEMVEVMKWFLKQQPRRVNTTFGKNPDKIQSFFFLLSKQKLSKICFLLLLLLWIVVDRAEVYLILSIYFFTRIFRICDVFFGVAAPPPRRDSKNKYIMHNKLYCICTYCV